MKMITRIWPPHTIPTRFITALLAGFFVLGVLASVEAGVVTNSSAFSVGYGFNGTWNTQETSAVNQPVGIPRPNESGIFTNGDFVIKIRVKGSFNSSQGVTFTNRVLTSAITGSDQTAQSLDTTIRVVIDYIGGTPRDASRQPNYTLQLHIAQLSVHAAKISEQLGGSTNQVWWIETTKYHTNQSSAVTTPVDQSIAVATNYAKVLWNPPHFDELGNHCERTFAFPSDRNFLIDGLEIVGSARLIYIAVPGRTDRQ